MTNEIKILIEGKDKDCYLRKSNLLIALAAEFQSGAISKEEYFSKLGDIS